VIRLPNNFSAVVIGLYLYLVLKYPGTQSVTTHVLSFPDTYIPMAACFACQFVISDKAFYLQGVHKNMVVGIWLKAIITTLP